MRVERDVCNIKKKLLKNLKYQILSTIKQTSKKLIGHHSKLALQAG